MRSSRIAGATRNCFLALAAVLTMAAPSLAQDGWNPVADGYPRTAAEVNEWAWQAAVAAVSGREPSAEELAEAAARLREAIARERRPDLLALRAESLNGEKLDAILSRTTRTVGSDSVAIVACYRS